MGPRTKECGPPFEAGKSKTVDSSPELPEGDFDFSPVRLFSHYFFSLEFIYFERERERERERAHESGGAEREKETKNPKQALHCQSRARCGA